MQELQDQLEQGQSPDVVNGNVVSPLTAEVEGLRQENSLYKQQVEVSYGVCVCVCVCVAVSNVAELTVQTASRSKLWRVCVCVSQCLT